MLTTLTVSTNLVTQSSTISAGNGAGWIGRDTFGGYMMGELSMIALWNTVLTADEVRNVMLSNSAYMPLQIRPSNLLGLYLFNEFPNAASCSGTLATRDYSQNARHATPLINPVAFADPVLTYP